MLALDELTPTARRFAKALIRYFPEFAENLQLLPGGQFSASIPAPPASKARALRCLSTGDGDLWIQLALPNAFYHVENVPEMRRVLHAVLSDGLAFLLIFRNRKWTETTLVEVSSPVRVRAGDVARVVSWSGTRDFVASHQGARSSATKAASSPRNVRRQRQPTEP